MIITKQAFHDLIQVERDNQIELWGHQQHSDEKWMNIIVEELGEAAKAINDDNEEGILEETVQVAALLEAWVTSRTFF